MRPFVKFISQNSNLSPMFLLTHYSTPEIHYQRHPDLEAFPAFPVILYTTTHFTTSHFFNQISQTVKISKQP